MRRLLVLTLLLAACGAEPTVPPAMAPLGVPEALAVQGDSLLIADPTAAAVWRLDLTSHEIARVQGEPVGPDFVAAGGLAPLPEGGFLATGMGRGLSGLVRAGPEPGMEVVTKDLRLPLGVATDGQRAWVADSLRGQVVEIDLGTGRTRTSARIGHPAGICRIGERTFVTDPDAGVLYVLAGGAPMPLATGLQLPTGLAAKADGDLLVLEATGLTQVDPLTGAHSQVASGFGQATGLATSGRHAWVADAARGQVVQVDLGSGETTPVLLRSLPDDAAPDHLVVQGDSALVTGGGLHRVRLADGARTPVEAPATARPFGVALVQGRPVLTDPGRAAVVTLDEAVSAFGLRGRGPRFVEPEALAEMPDGDLVVTDISLGALFRVDLPGGDRSLLAGSGADLQEPSAVVVRDGALLVADLERGAVLEVDVASGKRRDLVTGLESPGALALDGDGLLIADDGRHAVLRCRPPGWKPVPIEGRGLPFLYPSGLAKAPGGNWLVADHEARVVLEMRPNGDRRALQPRLVSPGAMAVAGEDRVLVADSGLGGLLQVDLGTGVRTRIEAEGLKEPEGLVALPEGGVLVSDLLLRGLARLDGGRVEKLDLEGLSRPTGLALGHAGLLVADEGVFRVDLKRRRATRVDQAGVALVEPVSVAWRGLDVLVADPALGAVVRVDEKGTRSVLPGTLPLEPMGLVANGLRTFVLDAATGAVLEYGAGRFSVWSRWGERGDGPPLVEPVSGVVAGGRLLVADAAQDAIFAVDLVHGHRDVLSPGWPVAEEPPPLVSALAWDGGLIVADAGGGRVVRGDGAGSPASGNAGGGRTEGDGGAGPGGGSRAWRVAQVADGLVRPMALTVQGGLWVGDPGRGTVGRVGGPPLLRDVRCEGLAALPDGSLLVSDRRSGRLLRVPSGGAAKPVGPALLGAAGVAAAGRTAVVLDERNARLVLVDLPTGGSRVLEGKGPEMVYPSHVAVLPDGAFVVADEGGPFLLRVDARSGDRSVLSGPGRGTGPALERPRPVLVHAGRVYVGDGSRVLEVDPRTGHRTVALELEAGR